jgi:cardiolipin synthase (CMP-forming)
MPDRLSRSIVATVSAYVLFQAVLFLGFGLAAGFAGRYGASFAAVSLAFHVVLVGMLLFFRRDFVKEATGERLERVNLANRITLLRVSTLPTLLFLVIAARDYRIRYPLLALVILVFATDFVDGYVSRKAGEVTKIGRMMDSASDYSLLVVLTIVFYYFKLIPVWLFLLVVARLGVQAVFMGILMAGSRKTGLKTTVLGKIAVAAIMVLYAAEVLRLLFAVSAPIAFGVLEWATGSVVAAGIADKIAFFVRELRRAPEPADSGKA